MTFTCRQCGTCCMYLGDYIAIEEQIGPFAFRCESVSTGTTFTATVDEDKRGIFSDFSFREEHPHACRFLRPDGEFVRCTIHRDSPAQCKDYRCVVLRIADAEGKPLGYVTGTLALHSDDRALRVLWDEVQRKRPGPSELAEPWIARFLVAAGYRVG